VSTKYMQDLRSACSRAKSASVPTLGMLASTSAGGLRWGPFSAALLRHSS
jgi:hypothetical protein